MGWLVVSVFVVFVDMFFVGFVIDSFIVFTVDSFIVFAINSLVTFSIESFATFSIESFVIFSIESFATFSIVFSTPFSIVFSTPFSIESTTPSLFSGRCGVECSDPSASCDRFLAATGVVGSESERVGVSCVAGTTTGESACRSGRMTVEERAGSAESEADASATTEDLQPRTVWLRDTSGRAALGCVLGRRWLGRASM